MVKYSKKLKKYVLAKDIVIPAGTEIAYAADRVERFVPFGEAVIGFNKDMCGDFTMPLDEMLEIGLVKELD